LYSEELMICTYHKVLFEWSNRGRWDWRDILNILITLALTW